MATTSRPATPAELRKAFDGCDPMRRAALLAGEIPIFADRAGSIRLTVPEDVSQVDLSTRALAAPLAPTPSSDVLAAVAVDDSEITAAEQALIPRSQSRHTPIAPRLQSTRSASEIVLEEIAAMSAAKHAGDDLSALMPVVARKAG